MKHITKFFTAVCALSSLALCAEVTNFDSTMWKFFTSKPKFEGTKITAMANVGLNSKQTFTVEEGKTYTLSMDVKRVSESEKNPTILFGFEGLSKEGKPLPVYSYQFIPNTFTEVVADAKECMDKALNSWNKLKSALSKLLSDMEKAGGLLKIAAGFTPQNTDNQHLDC